MSRKRYGESRTCPKVEIRSDGSALLNCRGLEGEPLIDCSKSSEYSDLAFPLSEQLCERAVARHEPHMNDAYKQPYVAACHNLDETMADSFRADSSENLKMRFEVMERELENMINSPELNAGDKGRYLYHIDARVLHAFLPAFWHRAEYGHQAPVPEAVIEDTYKKVVGILDDFGGLYSGIATQVALRRTEVEVIALLLRTKKPEFFAYPTLFREDASETRSYNHDAYVIEGDKKVAIQVKNTDYKMSNGQRAKDGYANQVVVAIHQNVVNLDYTGKETVVTKVGGSKREIDHEHDVVDDEYLDYDEQPRYVAWGAVDTSKPEDVAFAGEYVQVLDNGKRDGLLAAISKESHGKQLSPTDRNLLNGASHYLMAVINEKRRMLDS